MWLTEYLLTFHMNTLPIVNYVKSEYIETVCYLTHPYIPNRNFQDTGNKVSRRATIAGPQNIILGGKSIIANGAIIRGDLRRTGPGHAVVISLGRYCLVGESCVLRYDLSAALTPLTLHQTTVQDLSRKFQLLSYESRRPRSYRGWFCGRSSEYRKPRRNWEKLRDRSSPHLPRLPSSKSDQGKFTIIKDCARIADNTILPPNTVVPALALFSGSPGQS